MYEYDYSEIGLTLKSKILEANYHPCVACLGYCSSQSNIISGCISGFIFSPPSSPSYQSFKFSHLAGQTIVSVGPQTEKSMQDKCRLRIMEKNNSAVINGHCQ